ncbi:MAG: thiamine pyrophosphate-dependent enzyme [Bacteroidota bacterium]
MTTFLKDVEKASIEPLTDDFIQEVKADFWVCCLSREMSLLGRKEVLTGKAKFGIFGDGKEVPQVAMARAFRKGDWRSGYYRDQTLMLALGVASLEDLFAQLYADAENDRFSKGRQMNAHFATPTIDEDARWIDSREAYNISADVSCTAGQMPRAVGLAMASKVYRESKVLEASTNFSEQGNEVCFCTIGDASTSEGVFWEAINAAGVMQIPMAVSVWDDGYGISVPVEYQTTKGSISKALDGLKTNADGKGIEIYEEKGWDYAKLRKLYEKGIARMRENHTPAVFHIVELTQPQGHSTSGSHERYKSEERLDWEARFDCIAQMRNWMIAMDIATAEELNEMRKKAKKQVKEARNKAWEAYNSPFVKIRKDLEKIYEGIIFDLHENDKVKAKPILRALQNFRSPTLSDLVSNARKMYFHILKTNTAHQVSLENWLQIHYQKAEQYYHTDLYSDSPYAATKVAAIEPVYTKDAVVKSGFQILNAYFDQLLKRDPRVVAFGEDVGNIGDVNQGFAGLQEAHGEERVFDTGIREWTIMGQAIGLAMRGLRPIAEIQYLDYLVYGLEPLTDDLATLRYRSGNIQQAPAIIRTRGHRLEGIWHAGSPMSMLLSSLRGLCILVPRNMVQAAGFYNTMIQSDDPALIIESLNAYRLKEREPDNLGTYTLPVGKVEVLKVGTDVTLVTYGSCVRIAEAGIKLLNEHGISVELIDVQSLLPFDLSHDILQSLRKTNRIVFMDEDIPGGATAYMMQEVLEKQGGYQYLDSQPLTLTAKSHRPPYGSDGDYFSKPNEEDVFQVIYQMMKEVAPNRYGNMRSF